MRSGNDQQIVTTERELRSLRNLYALGDGWPFGDGPMQWFCHLEIRPANAFSSDPDQMHILCDNCGQSVFCMTPRYWGRGFTWNLELLKSRVADHVLKCHPDAAT